MDPRDGSPRGPRALADVDWRTILAKLRRLRRSPDAEDALGTAVLAVLTGRRRIKQNVDMVTFSASALRSTRWSANEREERRRVQEEEFASMELESVVPSPATLREREESQERLHAWIEQRTAADQRDPDVGALCHAILEGAEKRREQAALLGWSLERVDAARKRLERKLAGEPTMSKRSTTGPSLRRATPREIESDLRRRNED